MTKVNVCYVKAGEELKVPTKDIILVRVAPPQGMGMGMGRKEEKVLEIWFVGKSETPIVVAE